MLKFQQKIGDVDLVCIEKLFKFPLCTLAEVKYHYLAAYTCGELLVDIEVFLLSQPVMLFLGTESDILRVFPDLL